jgi:hypothetical protein
MSLDKRGSVYWFEILHNGQRIPRSTGVKSQREARHIEAAILTQLVYGEVGIGRPKKVPRFSAFAKEFLGTIQTRCAEKPATVRFHSCSAEQ